MKSFFLLCHLHLTFCWVLCIKIKNQSMFHGLFMCEVSTKKKMQPLSQKQKMLQQRFLQECPYTDLTVRFRSWEEKVVAILNVVRRREITERNPRTHWEGPTRFCGYNIAFFDFERECEHPWLIYFPCSLFLTIC